MSLLVSNSIPNSALKKMPAVCAEILKKRGVNYFESLELFVEELEEMSPTVFKDSVIDMVAFNPQEFDSSTWLFQEAFYKIYPNLTEAMLFELSQTASDLVENLQDYFWDFKIHEAELRILESFYETTKKYAFINHLRSQDFNLLVAIIESEKILSQLKMIPDDADILEGLDLLQSLSESYENFLMDNPLCPNFLVNSGIAKKIHSILEFNYEFLLDGAEDILEYNQNLKYSMRPFSVKVGLKESVLANQDLWDSYCQYLIDCLKIETMFARDKIEWGVAYGKYYFYKNEYELSFQAFKKTQTLLLEKLLGYKCRKSIDLAMFKKRVEKLGPVHKECFYSCCYYLKTLRKSLINHFAKTLDSNYTTKVLLLLVDMMEVFEFLPDLFSVQEFVLANDLSTISKYYPLNESALSIIKNIQSKEFNLSQAFLSEITQSAFCHFQSDLSDVLL